MAKDMNIKKYKISVEGRIDKVLADLTNTSRNKIQALIEAQQVLVNDKVVTKANLMLEANDEVKIQEMDLTNYLSTEIKPYDYPLEVLYEDEYFLIINKPSGYLTHPTTYNEPDTILNMALAYFKNKGINQDPWMVHRLDKDTSGILMIAKGYDALIAMQKIFNERDVTKKYYALVHNRFNDVKKLLIDVPIARSFQHKLKMNAITGKNPKPAQTEVEVIENYPNTALVSCNLLTGRTHQIRVHLRHINHPIINDDLYGIEKETTPYKQYLHAYYLAFVHPFINKPIELQTKMPSEFVEKIKQLKE